LRFGLGGAQDGDAGVGPKLASEERDARISLDLARGLITVRDVRPDQEFLSVLIERVGGYETTRQLHRPGGIARREFCSRRLPEHPLGRSGQMSPACQEPRLEPGAGGKHHAFQQFSTEAGNVDRLDPGACSQGMDVYERARWQSKDDWRAFDRCVRSEEPA
jgi:hypothetical protein